MSEWTKVIVSYLATTESWQDRHVLLALLGSRNLRSGPGLRPSRYHRPSALHPTNIQPQHSTAQIAVADERSNLSEELKIPNLT